jgi:hypothetical protein
MDTVPSVTTEPVRRLEVFTGAGRRRKSSEAIHFAGVPSGNLSVDCERRCEAIADDSAADDVAQIVNLLWSGTSRSYSAWYAAFRAGFRKLGADYVQFRQVVVRRRPLETCGLGWR